MKAELKIPKQNSYGFIHFFLLTVDAFTRKDVGISETVLAWALVTNFKSVVRF